MNDWRDRYDLMQRLNDRSNPLSWREDIGALSWMILIGMIGLFVSLVCLKSCEPVPAAARNVYQKPCTDCHNHKAALTQYLKKNGSKSPGELADALVRSRSPRLLSAIAVIESGGNKNAINARHGYKSRAVGVYQIKPKYWGVVPQDVYGQTMQAERILEELVETKNIKTALSHYGGDSTARYANKVLAELKEVP